jgi:geranylgeranyl reductase family protein
MRRYDVVIVGGGPVGGLVAKQISSQGFSTLILEEDKQIGVPVRCAGLVTNRVLRLVDISQDIVLNRIKGACVHFPGGHQIDIGGQKTHAYSIDRERFDKEIVHKAVANGAELRLNSKVIDVDKQKVFLNGGQEIGYRFLVGSDGPRSIIRQQYGFPKPKEMILGMNAEVPYDHDSSSVDIFFGEDIAPGFFSWIIPAGDMTRIGLGVKQGYNPGKYFQLFLEKLHIDFPVSAHAGFIPLGPITRLIRHNVALVGDAACQVKPSSGGGLFPGLIAALFCGKAIVKALEDDVSLKAYPKNWFLQVGKELRKGYVARKFFLHMDDQKLEKLFSILNTKNICSIINDYGDIDYPSKVILHIVKQHPLLLRFLPFFLF